MIEARSQLTFDDVPDARQSLKRLSAGASMAAPELLEIKAVLERARKTKGSLTLVESSTFPRLTDYLPRLHAVEPLARAIDAAIDPSGQVKDEASKRLQSLRHDVKRLDSQIREELARIIHSSTLSKALQEPLFTQRSGRYVLPVNSSQRQAIEGIVHDSSASGLTVYVEPTAVVELSNKVRLREVEIEHEIARILSELSELARKHKDEIDSSFHTLIDLDVIAARARLALRYKGQRPGLSSNGELHLKNARHPLLILQDPDRASRVVPNNITLGGDKRTIVVTGPNTGGKTVLLKTAGLLSYMASAGMLLPVAPGSQAVIFEDICADIGDEQSLAQNLSTFSSHMTNVVQIINQSREGYLILLDEVGAGTDPREGAALARAILEYLNASGALTISTTHYGELKTLAYSQDGFINASLDFDDATLSPTYKLRLGVPGSSKATTIAKRLGLKEQVVAAASSYMEEGQRDLQKLIEELEIRLKALATAEEAANSARQTAEQMEQRARAELADIDAHKENLRQSLTDRIEEEFNQARQQLRQLIASLQKQPSMKVLQQTQQQIESIRKDLKWTARREEPHQHKTIRAGMRVRVKSLNQVAIVEAAPEHEALQPNATATVRSGNMKMIVPVCDLEVLAQTGGANRQSTSKSTVNARASKGGNQVFGSAQGPDVFVRTASNTLDLRGKRVEEALLETESFLDRASMSGTHLVMIIHGHGTGAVKAAVRQYLSTCAYSKNYRPGETYEGGDGVTVVDLS